MMFKKFRKKHGLYDLRKEVAAWVEKNIGAEFIEDALDKYDKIIYRKVGEVECLM